MKKEYGVYAAVAAFIGILVTGLWWMNKGSSQPTSQEQVSTTTQSGVATSTVTSTSSALPAPTPATTQTPQPAPAAPYAFALVQGETVSSWDFAGSHNDGGQLEARVRAEIEKLKGLISNPGDVTKYEIYISIANQYELLGEGQQEFVYLNYALGIDGKSTGLAWHNMGKLLERLGAYKSARTAYDAMVNAQPIRQYLQVRLDFLKAHMPEDTGAIQQAEAAVAASAQ